MFEGNYLDEFDGIPTDPYIRDDERMLSRSGYSIFAAVYIRVNCAAHIHDSMHAAMYDIEETYRYIDSEVVAGRRTLHDLNLIDRRRKIIREKRYNLRLFIYTHLDIIAKAKELNSWKDRILMQRAKHRNANYCLRNYDEVMPYDTRVYHEGMLPDIAKYICCIPFPDQKDAGVRENNTSTTHLFRMIGLLLPRNNVTRTNNKQHIKLCTDHAAYRKLTSIILYISFTGGYRHSNYLMPLAYCLTIRDVMSSPNSEEFMHWQRYYKSLAIMAMREFVIFQISKCPPYYYYLLHEYPYWEQYVKQTLSLLDVLRLSTRYGCSMSAIQYGIQSIVKPKANAQACIEPIIAKIIDMLVGQYKTIDWSNCQHEVQIDELCTLCRHLFVINVRRARKNVIRTPLPRLMRKAIITKVNSIPRHSPIDLAWLLEFNFGIESPPESVNVSMQTIKLLEYAFYYILMGPQKTQNVNLALSKIDSKDYEIVDSFFFKLFTHYSIDVIPLDALTAERQYKAVLKRNDLTDEDQVSPWAMSLMFAPCCGTIRSYITQKGGALLYGGDKVGFNPHTGDVVCRQKTDYHTAKRTYRMFMSFYDKLLAALDRSDEKTLIKICNRISRMVSVNLKNKYFDQSRCGDVPLVMVPLVGYIVQVTIPKVSITGTTSPTTNAFTICEQCGGTMLFSTKFFGPNGLCCQQCCVAHTVETHTPMCVAKAHRIKLNTPVHKFRVIDDREDVGTYTISTMYVCDRCYTRKTAGYRQYENSIVSASHLAKMKHFDDNSMAFYIALASGEPLAEYFDTRVSNFVSRARTQLERTLKKK